MKSIAVSVNSCSIESADFVAHLAVVAVDRFENALARGQRDVHFAVENELQLLERLVVERIADQHLERTIFLGQRNDRVLAGDRFGHQFDHRRRNRHIAQVEELIAVHVGHRLHDLLAGGVALLDEDLVDLAAVVLGDGLRLGQLLRADDAPPDEKFAQVCHDRTAQLCVRFQTLYSLRAHPAQMLQRPNAAMGADETSRKSANS